MENELPADLKRLAVTIDQQPPRVREAVQLCLAVALQESGKAKLVNAAQIKGRTHYSYRTVAGHVFTAVRPHIDAETEKALSGELVAILKGDKPCTVSLPCCLPTSPRMGWWPSRSGDPEHTPRSGSEGFADRRGVSEIGQIGGE